MTDIVGFVVVVVAAGAGASSSSSFVFCSSAAGGDAVGASWLGSEGAASSVRRRLAGGEVVSFSGAAEDMVV